MYKNKKILALIPARAGSKGLPNKNIRLLAGKPLIAWTIEQANKSIFVDKIIVSTDSVKIAEISRYYGAWVPFMRPKRLATDNAKIINTILYTLAWLEKNNHHYDLLLLLQPTSPLISSRDIDNATKLLFKKKAQAIVSVTKATCSPYWVNILPRNLCMSHFVDKRALNKNRQDLPSHFQLNGGIYLGYKRYIKKQKGFFGHRTFAYIMPAERSVDIDSEIDFALAELLKQKYNI